MAENEKNKIGSVLFIAGDAEIRGITAYTYNLAIGLLRRGIRVEMFCPGGCRLGDFEKAGITITEAPLIGRRIYDYFGLGRLVEKAREAKVRLIHAQSPGVLRAAAKFADRLCIPIVVTMHDFLPEGKRFPISPRKLAGVVAVSEAVRTDLVTRRLVPKELIRVLPPGVDVECLCRYRPRVEERKTMTIGAIGRLTRMKGHQHLIEAAKILFDRNVDVQIVISGEGQDLKYFRKLAKDNGMINRLTFVAPSSDNTAIYSSLDVFVMPSLKEGLGHVMLEAMACRIPVVATGVGGVYGIIIDGETGLLVPQGDSCALADALYRFVEEHELAEKLGENGRKHVLGKFNLERMASETAEFYSNILEEAAVT
ncbi:MAG: glycosyltransferase family 4 protein [Planctomycetota bacterium]|jgi:glycosyltransferase involved in cell wall biosynthesis